MSSSSTSPAKGSGWKNLRRAISRAARLYLREPLRKIREPARNAALNLLPGAPLKIARAEDLALVAYRQALPEKGARCLVTPDAPVDIKFHPLSVQSDDPGERVHYADHRVISPGLSLENPGPQFWFARSGALIAEDGKIWPHSFMAPFRRDRLRTVKSISVAQNGPDENGLIFHPLLLKGALRVKGRHFLTAQPGSPNFGHFLLDIVPLIALGKEISAPMLTWPLRDWQKQIIARVNPPAGLLREIPFQNHWIEEPVVSNRMAGLGAHIAHPAAKASFDAIRATVDLAAHKNLPRKFFLMRGAGHGRAMSNRLALGEALAKLGVVALQPELLSFEQQVALFAQAELVVCEFGAALANVVFCRPGTKVLEIITMGQHDPWSSRLCAMLGLEHVVYFQRLTEAEILARGDRFAPSPDFAYHADLAPIVDLAARLLA